MQFMATWGAMRQPSDKIEFELILANIKDLLRTNKFDKN